MMNSGYHDKTRCKKDSNEFETMIDAQEQNKGKNSSKEHN